MEGLGQGGVQDLLLPALRLHLSVAFGSAQSRAKQPQEGPPLSPPPSLLGGCGLQPLRRALFSSALPL